MVRSIARTKISVMALATRRIRPKLRSAEAFPHHLWSAHQLARLGPVKEAGREGLEVAVDGISQVKNGALGHPFHDDALRIIEDGFEEHCPDQKDRQLGHPCYLGTDADQVTLWYIIPSPFECLFFFHCGR